MEDNNAVGEGLAAVTLYVFIAILLASTLTGCIGQALGVKEYHNGDTHILFTTASDFSIAWGQYDAADKRKSIKPGGGYYNASKPVMQRTPKAYVNDDE